VRSVDLPEDAEIPEAALQRLRALPPINIYRILAIVPQVGDPVDRSHAGRLRVRPVTCA
jgi:hypothetical protein